MRLIKTTIFILLIAICSLIIAASPVFSVVITGSVYGPDFDTLNDAVVRIDTKPVQQILAKNGSYEFNVPEGIYELNAYYKGSEGEKYFFSEKIEAKGNGQYVLDIIMLPDTEGSITPYPEGIYGTEPSTTNSEEKTGTSSQKIFTAILIVGLFIIVAIGVVLYFLRKKRKTKIIIDETDKDESYEKVLEMIKKNKRMTQKDITKEMFLSDAKVSLILTEMESKGIIKKVKKGRTNVIILNR
jgi:uncharacterized membrane protein